MLGAALHKIMYRQPLPLKAAQIANYNTTLQSYNILKAEPYKVKKKKKWMYPQTTHCRHEICLTKEI